MRISNRPCGIYTCNRGTGMLVLPKPNDSMDMT